MLILPLRFTLNMTGASEKGQYLFMEDIPINKKTTSSFLEKVFF